MNLLRGLFGSSARQNVTADPQAFVAVTDPRMDDPITRQVGASVMRRAPVIRPDRAADSADRSQRLATFGAALSDAGIALRGGQGNALARVQEAYRKRAKEELALRQQEQMQAMAKQLYGDDPEAQLLFMADPEAFVGARAERLKPRTMSEGQTYVDPMTGERYTTPTVEKFDDRFGYYDPATGEARFSDPRGPTYQEQTGRQSADEIGRHNRQAEGIGWSNTNRGWAAHRARMAAGGYGTPGVGMAAIPDDDVEID